MSPRRLCKLGRRRWECQPRFHHGVLASLMGFRRYLHDMKVVHRDIKPSNVVLTRDWTAQLTDFGISRVTDSDRTMTKNIGSVDYMAPETIDADVVADATDSSSVSACSTNRNQNLRRAAVDVYAFSILIAVLFNGSRPYASVPAAAVRFVW